MTLSLDHTKRTHFVDCPRKYQLNWLLNIKPRSGSTALRYGIAWHSAMEGFYNVLAEKGWKAAPEGLQAGVEAATKSFAEETSSQVFWDDYRTLENLGRSFDQFYDHFRMDEGMLEIVESEKIFSIKMKPTEIEKDLFPGIQPINFTGRIDNVVKLNLRPWLLEHKTTGQHLATQVNRLQRSPQVIGYNYAARAIYKEVPEGSLVVLHHLSAYKRKDGSYGDPKIDFQRVPQIYTMEDLANWRLGFMSDAYRLQHCLNRNLFPMNHYSCYTYGTCTYANLCEQNKPPGTEHLHNYFIDEDPWDTLKDAGDKLITLEEEEGVWSEHLQKILP